MEISYFMIMSMMLLSAMTGAIVVKIKQGKEKCPGNAPQEEMVCPLPSFPAEMDAMEGEPEAMPRRVKDIERDCFFALELELQQLKDLQGQ